MKWSGKKKRIFKGQKKMQGKSKKLALVILIQDLSLQKLLTYYQRSLQRDTLKNQRLLKVFGPYMDRGFHIFINFILITAYPLYF